MSVFPESIRCIYPVVLEPEWLTLVSDMDDSGEQRRQKWLFCKFNVRVRYTRLSATDMQTLWDFYQARKGAFDPFNYYEPGPTYGIVTSYKDLYIGIGNASTTVFDIPGKSTSTRTLYKNGAVQSSGFSYLTGGGADGADRVQFTGAPALGDVISIDFTGSLRVRCRFREDRLPRELFIRKLYQYGIDLKGLGPA